MKAYNMTSNNGNKVPNQFIIEHGKDEYFQSYRSVIVHKKWTPKGYEITLDEQDWNYSRTTSKYRNDYLGETTKETEKKIKEGVYKLANLNRY